MNENLDLREESTHKFKHKNLISSTFLTLAVLILTAILSLQVDSSVSSVEAAPSDLVCPADALAYWTLDENSSPFVDLIQGNNATCSGSACPSNLPSGRVGSALDFNGSNDRLTVSNSSSLNFGSSFSIEVWVQTSSSCSTSQTFVSKRGSSGARWWVGCARSSGNTDRAAFYLRDSNGNETTIYSTNAIDDNQWHHIVAVRDAAANTNRLYVDGAQVATGTTNYSGNFTNNGDLLIGALQTSNSSSNIGNYTNGNLDEIALYNRALTPAEITDHYNNGTGKAYCIEAVAPQITVIPNQTAVVGQLFTYSVQATGTPAPTFSLTTAPSGMTINSTTGVISWTPAATGTFNVTVQATNSAGSATRNFSITVNALPSITAIADQTAVAGDPFIYDVEASGVPAPTFSLIQAPEGMTINSTTGVVNWTPAAAGSYVVTVRASNVAGNYDESFTINVNARPAFSPISDQLAVVGQLFTYDVEAIGTPAPTFELTVAPTGMTIDPNTGVISWTPGAIGTYDVTVQATNTIDTAAISFKVTVNTLPAITAVPDQAVNVGDTFTYDVDASGVPAPTFSLVQAPVGMSIDANTGIINWTPAAAGSYDVTVRASNVAGNYDESFTITVNALPAFTPVPDQGAIAGQLFTYDVEATGAPAPTFELTVAPTGMTIDPTTGVIEWTPDADGVYNVTVAATNSVGTVTISFNINVASTPFINTIFDKTAVVGQLFTYQVQATGNPAPTFELTVAPTGMTIDPTTGVISWTPDAIGTYDVTVEADNGAGTATASFKVTVNTLPTIAPIPDQTANASQVFALIVEATGDPAPTFSLVEAPVGMSIEPNLGIISWLPITGGVHNVTVAATNAAGTVTISFTITVYALPIITPIPGQMAVVNQLFTYDVETAGLPAPTFELTVAPAGMTIDPNTGVISWTPTNVGNAFVTVAATNSVGTVTAFFNVTVNALPAINDIPDQTAVAGNLFTYDAQASGSPAPTFSLQVAPAGMTIDANTGIISWTPAATGSYDVTVRASNVAGNDDESFTINVGTLPTITAIPAQTAVVGQLFTYDVEATGVPAPTFSLVEAPDDMTIDAATGVINWTPTTAGTVNVTVRAENAVGNTTANFVITVEEDDEEEEEVTYSIFLPSILMTGN